MTERSPENETPAWMGIRRYNYPDEESYREALNNFELALLKKDLEIANNPKEHPDIRERANWGVFWHRRWILDDLSCKNKKSN